MKHCPLCESQYADETLRFCLQDGTPLGDAKQSSIDTVAFSNPLTVEKIPQTEELRVKLPGYTQKWEAKKPPATPAVGQRRVIGKQPQARASGRVWLMALLPVLLVLGGAGLAGWYYLNNQSAAPAAQVKMLSPENTEKKMPANSAVLSSEDLVEKTPQPATSTTQPNNVDGVKTEIANLINSWKDAAEARNVADYTAKYAETVDYYEKDGTNIKEIRSEVQKIFSAYSDIDINLSNIRVAVDGDGDKATAIFDKEWAYETGKDLLESKAHTELQFQKNGNDWKIISEKNLKVYYTEK